MRRVSFKTERKSEIKKRKAFAIGFVALAAGVLIVSVLIILIKNNFDLNLILSGEVTPQSSQEEIEEEKKKEKFTNTYLLWCDYDEKQSLSFLISVRVNLPGKATVSALLPSQSVTEGEKKASLDTFYRSGGAPALKNAVEISEGIKCGNYLGADRNSFCALIDYIGLMTVDVPGDIDYRGEDFNLILMKGENSLKGDTLFKYFTYLSRKGEEGLEEQENIARQVLAIIFSEKYEQKGEKIFRKMADLFTTDLTIYDYTKNKKAFEAGNIKF